MCNSLNSNEFALPAQFKARSSSFKSGWSGFSFAEVQIVEEDGYVYMERHSLHIEQICGPLLLRPINRKYYRQACLAPTLRFPGSELARYWQGLQRGLHLSVHPKVIERYIHHPFQTDAFALSERSQPVIEQLLHAFLLDVQAGHPTGALLGETLLTGLLHLLLSNNNKYNKEIYYKDIPMDTFKRLVEFIDANLTEPLSLDDLARESSLSVRQISRIFQEKTGMSPYRYIIVCRVNRAKRLVASNKYNLEEIAAESGFAHAAHMINAFRKVLNATPSQFGNRRK